METIEALKNAMYEANQQAREAHEKANKAEQAVANAIAESLGVTIGCTVVQRKRVGWGSKEKIQERRYKVERFRYEGYGVPPISIIGRTIRKDGTEGERHELWGDFEVEAQANS